MELGSKLAWMVEGSIEDKNAPCRYTGPLAKPGQQGRYIQRDWGIEKGDTGNLDKDREKNRGWGVSGRK